MTPTRSNATNPPSPAEWRDFLGRTFVVLAAGSLLAAVVCFIAFNWNHMGPSFKMALVEVAMVGLSVLAWRLGFTGWAGPLAIFSAAFLVGPLLAIYGQAYPTGAPLSKLLYMWASIAAVVAGLTRTEGTWLLSLIVLNTALFYWGPFSDGDWTMIFGKSTRFIALGVVDLAAFAVSLVLPNWLPSNTGRRLLLFSGAFFLNIAFIWDVMDNWHKGFGPSLYLFLGVVAALVFFGFKKKDLFVVVVAALGMFSIGNTLILRALKADVFFLLTVLNLIAGAIAAYALNQLHRDWKERP